jgi:hypothetical protein
VFTLNVHLRCHEKRDGCKARCAGHGHSMAKRRNAADARLSWQPFGTGAIWAPPFVASHLQWLALRRVLLRGVHPKSPPSQARI